MDSVCEFYPCFAPERNEIDDLEAKTAEIDELRQQVDEGLTGRDQELKKNRRESR